MLIAKFEEIIFDFHVGKIEHDCLVFVAVGRPVIFGDPRIGI